MSYVPALRNAIGYVRIILLLPTRYTELLSLFLYILIVVGGSLFRSHLTRSDSHTDLLQ